MLYEYFKDLSYINTTLDLNYMLIPTNICNVDEEGMNTFNAYYENVLNQENWNKIVRTKSGGISISRNNFRPPMYDIRATNSCVELTVVADIAFRIQFRSQVLVDNVSGHKAFMKFKDVCKKHGIDLENYKIENGEQFKALIPKPMINVMDESLLDEELHQVHHIDFHSSFLSGLVNHYPEFRPVVEEIYNKRKSGTKNANDTYKAILTHTFGYMQSQMVNYAYSHLSYWMLEDNNERLTELISELIKHGRKPLLTNTDGIWYQGKIYHGPGEGSNICEWENDHINTIFRMKSSGAYEYVEDGVYNPVVRGRHKETMQKWGDIYTDYYIPKFMFIEGKGIEMQ